MTWALAGLFVAYIAGLLILGPVPSTMAAGDIFLLLDGGWRILNGLVPSRDYYLSLGPVTHMAVAAGLWVTHGNAYGITVGLTAFAAIVTIFAFLISRNRMTAAGSILFSAFILLLCTGPMPTGGNSSSDLTYAMIYNRFGYGVLSLMFVTQILRPKQDRGIAQDKDSCGDIVAGASLATLLFLKLSYFGVGGGLLLLTTIADRRTVRHIVDLALGFVPATLAFFALLRFQVFSFINDILETTRVRSESVSHFGFTDLFELSVTSIAALAICLLFLGPRDTSGRSRVWLLLLTAYSVLSEALFYRTNADAGKMFPLYAILVFILLADIGKTALETALETNVSSGLTAAIIVFGLALAAPAFYVHLRSLALLARYNTSPQIQAAASRVEGPHLQSLAFYDGTEAEELSRLEEGHFFTAHSNDGIELLKKYTRDEESVTTLGFQNIFSYALLRRPPTGGSIWLYLGNNVSREHLPSNERMFGNAKIVMIPKFPSTHQVTDQYFFKAYGPYLASDFSLVAESTWWRLYRRSEPAR